MYWWISYGFAPGEFGYPAVGQVVRHFRERHSRSLAEVAAAADLSESMLSRLEREPRSRCGSGLDSISRLRCLSELLEIPLVLLGLAAEESVDLADLVQRYRQKKSWTRFDLSMALGVTERLIGSMEKKGTSLDSLSRRRALQFLLGIPPTLLGLDAVHALSSVPAVVRASASPILPSLADITTAQKRLWSGYYTSSGQDELQVVRQSLTHLNDALPDLPAVQRPAYLEQLSLFYQASANITLATADTPAVLRYNQFGVKLARLSGNSDALAVALNRRAASQFELGYIEAAAKSIRESLSFARDPGVLASSQAVAARVLSTLAIDEQDRTEARSLADGLIVVDDDPYSVGLDGNILLVCRAQTLVNLSQHVPDRERFFNQALLLLDQADASAPAAPRRMLLIKLAQARAWLGLKEYEYAAQLSVDAFQLMQQIKSVLYLPQFSEIYQALSETKYKSSPQVARLGLLLMSK